MVTYPSERDAVPLVSERATVVIGERSRLYASPLNPSTEFVVAAALRAETGEIFLADHHADAEQLARTHFNLPPASEPISVQAGQGFDYGFFTSRDRFISRQRALTLAREQRQTNSKYKELDSHELNGGGAVAEGPGNRYAKFDGLAYKYSPMREETRRALREVALEGETMLIAAARDGSSERLLRAQRTLAAYAGVDPLGAALEFHRSMPHINGVYNGALSRDVNRSFTKDHWRYFTNCIQDLVAGKPSAEPRFHVADFLDYRDTTAVAILAQYAALSASDGARMEFQRTVRDARLAFRERGRSPMSKDHEPSYGRADYGRPRSAPEVWTSVEYIEHCTRLQREYASGSILDRAGVLDELEAMTQPIAAPDVTGVPLRVIAADFIRGQRNAGDVAHAAKSHFEARDRVVTLHKERSRARKGAGVER